MNTHIHIHIHRHRHTHTHTHTYTYTYTHIDIHIHTHRHTHTHTHTYTNTSLSAFILLFLRCSRGISSKKLDIYCNFFSFSSYFRILVCSSHTLLDILKSLIISSELSKIFLVTSESSANDMVKDRTMI